MTDKAEKEIWKTYPDYSFIEASNLGRIRTKDRYVTVKGQGERLIKGRVLKQQPQKGGYIQVQFSVCGKMVRLYVHRIVAICFLPNPNNYPEVNHKDCDPTNNRWDNLEWCTHQENIAYRDRLGHFVNNTQKKHVFAVNLETGKVLLFESQTEAARQLGVDQGNLNNVVNGKMNQIGSYWFTEDESEITDEKIREIKDNMELLCGVIAINTETSEVYRFESQMEATRQLNVHQSNIYKVLKGQYNKTGGYWFCYADENAVEKARKRFGDETAKKVEELMRQYL